MGNEPADHADFFGNEPRDRAGFLPQGGIDLFNTPLFGVSIQRQGRLPPLDDAEGAMAEPQPPPEAGPRVDAEYVIYAVKLTVAMWQIARHVKGAAVNRVDLQTAVANILPHFLKEGMANAENDLRAGHAAALKQLAELPSFPRLDELEAAFLQCREFLKPAEGDSAPGEPENPPRPVQDNNTVLATAAESFPLDIAEIMRVVRLAAAMLVIARQFPMKFAVSGGPPTARVDASILHAAVRCVPLSLLNLLPLPERVVLKFESGHTQGHRYTKAEFQEVLGPVPAPGFIDALKKLTTLFPTRDQLVSAFAPYVTLLKGQGSVYTPGVQQSKETTEQERDKETKFSGKEPADASESWEALAVPPAARKVAEIYRVQLLGAQATNADRKTLLANLRESGHPKILADSTSCLFTAQVSPRKAMPALRELLQHSSPLVQVAAIKSLGYYGAADAMARELIAVGRREMASPLILGAITEVLEKSTQPFQPAIEFLGDVALLARKEKDPAWRYLRQSAECGIKVLTEPPDSPRTPLDHFPVFIKLRGVRSETSRQELQAVLNEVSTFFREHRLADLNLNRQLCKEINAALRKTESRIACTNCQEAAPSVLYCRPGSGIPNGRFQYQHLMPNGKYSLHGGTVLLPEMKVVKAPPDRRKRNNK